MSSSNTSHPGKAERCNVTEGEHGSRPSLVSNDSTTINTGELDENEYCSLNILVNDDGKMRKKAGGMKLNMTSCQLTEMVKSEDIKQMESTLRQRFSYFLCMKHSFTTIDILVEEPQLKEEDLEKTSEVIIDIINKHASTYSIKPNSDERTGFSESKDNTIHNSNEHENSHDGSPNSRSNLNTDVRPKRSDNGAAGLLHDKELSDIDVSNNKSQDIYSHGSYAQPEGRQKTGYIPLRDSISCKYMCIAGDEIISNLSKKYSCSIQFSRITKETRKKARATMINCEKTKYEIIIAEDFMFFTKDGLVITTQELVNNYFKDKIEGMKTTIDDERVRVVVGSSFDLLIMKPTSEKKIKLDGLKEYSCYSENMILFLDETAHEAKKRLLKAFTFMKTSEESDRKTILIPFQEGMKLEETLEKCKREKCTLNKTVIGKTIDMRIGTLEEQMDNKKTKGAKREINVDVGYVSKINGKSTMGQADLGSYQKENRRLSNMTFVLQQCLLTQSKTTEISFPAFGTGEHGYPPDQVAECMLDVFHAYFEHTCIDEEHHLRHVSIVLPKDDQKIRQVFFNEYLKKIREEYTDDYVYKVELEIISDQRDWNNIKKEIEDVVSNKKDLNDIKDQNYLHNTRPDKTEHFCSPRSDLITEQKEFLKDMDRRNGSRCIFVILNDSYSMADPKNILYPMLGQIKPICYVPYAKEKVDELLVVFENSNDKNAAKDTLKQKQDIIKEVKDVDDEVMFPVEDAVYKVDPKMYKDDIEKVKSKLETSSGVITKLDKDALYVSGCQIQIQLAKSVLEKERVKCPSSHIGEGEPSSKYQEVTLSIHEYSAKQKLLKEKLRYINIKNGNCADGSTVILTVQVESDDKIVNPTNAMSTIRHEEIDVPEANTWAVQSFMDDHNADQETYMYFDPKKNVMHIYGKDYNCVETACHQFKISVGLLKITNRKEARTRGVHPSSTFSDPVKDSYKTLNKGITVYVMKDNICKLMNIDVIVNAANGGMTHGGGVAREISKAGGERINKESSDYVTQYGSIPVTGICKTSGGTLKCKEIYHAVGPNWSDYENKLTCEDDLCKTIVRCLVEADRSNYQSIAIPSISSVPETICTQMYVRAVRAFDHYHPVSSLQEIYFVDIRNDMVFSVQKEFDQTLKYRTDDDTAIKQFIIDITEETHEDRPGSYVESKTKKFAVAFNEETHEDHTQIAFTLPSAVQIRLSEADILSTNTEAITSWEDTSFSNLKTSSKWIIHAAGDEYKKERTDVNKSQLRAGMIVTTSPGNLKPFKHIFHFISSVNPSADEMQTLIENLIEETDNYNVSSVTIGVADNIKHLWTTLLKVLNEKTSTTLKEIHLVTNSKEKMVIKEFEDLIESVGGKICKGTCPICLDKFDRPVVLPCDHVFCTECLYKVEKEFGKCSICSQNVHGHEQIGRNQPHGIIDSKIVNGFIDITFSFKAGIQMAGHPDPGAPYSGKTFTTCLPDTKEGKEILKLLEKALVNRLLFTVERPQYGSSKRGCVVPTDILRNEILCIDGKQQRDNCRDQQYLDQLKEKLVVKGLTVK